MKYKYNGQWYDISIKALDGMPIGAIIAYPSNNIPNGWLECNGSTITSANYPELYDLIGGTLPNLKGRVIVGQDTSQTEFDTLGETGGSKALQEHSHGLGGQAVALGGTYQQVQNTGMTGGGMWGPATFGLNSTATTTAGTGNSGNLQPYVVYKWIIKAKQTTPLIASVVNSNSNSTTDTYSCSYINNAIPAVYDNYSASDSDGYSCNYANSHFGGIVLYNNASGDNGNITLNESVNNYSYIEIFYRTNDGDGYRGSIKLQTNNSMVASLTAHHYVPNTLYIKFKEINITGTSITNLQYVEYFFSNGSTVTVNEQNNIYITRVVGYK